MERPAAIAATIEHLTAELHTLIQVTKDALDEATGEQSRAENKYDTRGLEASYLAGAQSERLLELKRVLSFYGVLPTDDRDADAPIGMGSLVRIEESGRESWCLIAPDGRGRRVHVGDAALTLVSPTSPLGRSLIGGRTDDEVLLHAPQGVREIAICETK
ncbi:MAG: transcription elongation GreA/GreB family factor [Kiritimatiellia bacterium]|jgi:transcription elongation GreA/GreB family factor